MNNSSLITADRVTHLKIVAVALLASIAVMVIGIAARPGADATGPQVVKAGPSMLATEPARTTIR
ncbi:MAG TPA: hypothetical protein VKX28_20850 [Xanthobacteraceae bacterium]|jgi:hypothetical protein|nr:hypothetical protein [Xanthobacteraceae bacterium]